MEINWDKINKLVESNDLNDHRIALEVLKNSDIDLGDMRLKVIAWEKVAGSIANEYFNYNTRDLYANPDRSTKDLIIYSWR